MKEMKIRAFQPSDFEHYASTLVLTLPCDDLSEARENARLVMERLEREERELWVAETDGIPVGFMLLEFETDRRNVEIDWFDIRPDYQQQGVGTALIQMAENRTMKLGFLTVTIHIAASNHRMRKPAEKNGFAELQRLQAFWGEGTEDAYQLQKKAAR